jgi:3-(3-hydroxy-phenyl)propionate hydroxylase
VIAAIAFSASADFPFQSKNHIDFLVVLTKRCNKEILADKVSRRGSAQMPGETGLSRKSLAEADVVIVGAGPRGLMLANLLGLAGIQVTVLEGNEGLIGLPRAIAYDAETLRLFDQIGLLEAIAPGLVQNPPVRYLNASGRILMSMDLPVRGPFGHSTLGTFYQPAFERALLEGLSRFDNVEVLFGHKVVGLRQGREDVALRISASSGEREMQAKFVIGCDGGSSSVRGMIGSRLDGSTFVQRWLVVDAIVKDHDVRQISFHCDPRRPRVELPAVGDRVRWEFLQLPGEDENELREDQKVHSLIAENSKFRSVRIERKTVYAFHARVADRWRSNRVFLAGDAAHMMPPFAGQGMNGGMKDAVNLAWKLATVVKGLARDTILDSYEIERAPAVREMVRVSRRLGAVIMPTSAGVARVRDSIFAVLNLSRRFRAFVGGGGVLPPPALRRSALTGKRGGSLVGQMMPQPIVRASLGPALLDSFLTCHQWMAVGIGVDPRTMLAKRDLSILDVLGTRFVCINGDSVSEDTLELRCDDPAFAIWAKRHAVQAVLVRPDRFIADRLDPRGKELEMLNLFSQRSGDSPIPA